MMEAVGVVTFCGGGCVASPGIENDPLCRPGADLGAVCYRVHVRESTSEERSTVAPKPRTLSSSSFFSFSFWGDECKGIFFFFLREPGPNRKW